MTPVTNDAALSQPFSAGGLSRTDINRASLRLIIIGAVAFGVFLSGFVINEPAPYDLYMVAVIGVAFLAGLRLSAITVIPLTLFVIILIGGLGTWTQISDYSDAPMYYAVTGFLALTTVFYAAAIERNQALLKPIFWAYVAAAIGTGGLGTLGYLGLILGGEVFTLYGRAKGSFQDPNVFGPYLVLPALFLMHRILTGKLRDLVLMSPALLFILLALFLSFSRAAWGLMVFSGGLMVLLLFLQSESAAFRLRIMALAGIAFALIVVALLVALQVPQIADLFSERAKVVQNYDGARLGRFARHAIGFWLALEKPWGIGPVEFGKLYGEDTHAMWLKALMDYGWIGFFGWMTLFVWTLAAGFKILMRPRSWQPYLMCAWIVMLGHMFVGIVIDLDKWRHLYLCYGVIWGCVALEAGMKRRAIAGSAP
jgi:O-antigen ligase